MDFGSSGAAFGEGFPGMGMPWVKLLVQSRELNFVPPRAGVPQNPGPSAACKAEHLWDEHLRVYWDKEFNN